jgi:hypothetical protein
MPVKIHIVAFWVMTPLNVVGGLTFLSIGHA